MSDDMVDVYRRLALAIEPDLVESPIRWSALVEAGRHADGLHRFRVKNERGLAVSSVTRLGAWTAALEACQRRAAWRARKVEAKAEREAKRSGFAIVSGAVRFVDDDPPDLSA